MTKKREIIHFRMYGTITLSVTNVNLKIVTKITTKLYHKLPRLDRTFRETWL